jgi:hypothetical protein
MLGGVGRVSTGSFPITAARLVAANPDPDGAVRTDRLEEVKKVEVTARAGQATFTQWPTAVAGAIATVAWASSVPLTSTSRFGGPPPA